MSRFLSSKLRLQFHKEPHPIGIDRLAEGRLVLFRQRVDFADRIPIEVADPAGRVIARVEEKFFKLGRIAR